MDLSTIEKGLDMLLQNFGRSKLIHPFSVHKVERGKTDKNNRCRFLATLVTEGLS